MEKERVQELLDDFVVKNEQDINNVAVENPPLYDAFISALSLLSSKFGTSQEIKKLTEEEIEAKKPKKELPFKVGDVFMRGNLPESMKGEERDILYTILSIDESKSEVNYQINFVKKGTSKLNSKKIETILEDIEVGSWVPYEELKGAKYKVGDRFKLKSGDVCYIETVDELNGSYNYKFVYDSGSKVAKGTFFQYFIDKELDVHIDNGTIVYLGAESTTTPSITFKVGDIVRIKKSSRYYGTGYNNPKDINGKIFKIRDDGRIRVEWDNGDINSYKTEDLELSSSQPTNTSITFKVGDKFNRKKNKTPIYTISKIDNDKVYVSWLTGTKISEVNYPVSYVVSNFNDGTWVKVTAPTSTKATAKGTRVSPSQHASQTAVGTIMTGNDGNQWIVVEDSRGVRKWQRNIVKSTTKVISDEEQELLDAIEGAKLLANTGDSDAKKELSLLKAQLKKLKAK